MWLMSHPWARRASAYGALSALTWVLWERGVFALSSVMIAGVWLALHRLEGIARAQRLMREARIGAMYALAQHVIWANQLPSTGKQTLEVWHGELLVVLLGLSMFVFWRPRGGALRGWVYGLAVCVAPLAVFAPGLCAGVMLLVAGFERRDKHVMVVGLVTMLGALSAYYYMLSLTLLYKSFILIGLGLVLLLAHRLLGGGLSVVKEVGDAS
jgi:hypothetical protein